MSAKAKKPKHAWAVGQVVHCLRLTRRDSIAGEWDKRTATITELRLKYGTMVWSDDPKGLYPQSFVLSTGDSGGYYGHRVYADREAYDREQAAKAAWAVLRRRFESYQMPRGLTLEQIAEAHRVLFGEEA